MLYGGWTGFREGIQRGCGGQHEYVEGGDMIGYVQGNKRQSWNDSLELECGGFDCWLRSLDFIMLRLLNICKEDCQDE